MILNFPSSTLGAVLISRLPIVKDFSVLSDDKRCKSVYSGGYVELIKELPKGWEGFKSDQVDRLRGNFFLFKAFFPSVLLAATLSAFSFRADDNEISQRRDETCKATKSN
ncbi:hypothetical protein RUM44_001681 [Polyplax serrata]|uniref:Uncharacterized protein n=1 Tax=Polyplax serrata TaxID=468196 RepID=A0ABR1AL12_POLSC